MDNMLTPDTPVSKLDGVGKVKSKYLENLGIHTLYDLVYYFPRAHEARGNVIFLSNAEADMPAPFILTVGTAVYTRSIKRGLTISKFKAFDDSGSCDIVFFNSPFIKDVFQIGSEFRFYGKPAFSKGKISLTNPKYEPIIQGSPLPDFIPIYSATHGLSSKQINKLVESAISIVLPQIKDPLPEKIRIENNLPTLTYAIKNAHLPECEDSLKRAMTRLAFDEMLLFGLGISLSAERKNAGDGIKFSPCSLEKLTKLLPYELTPSQKNTINDIYRDTVIEKNGKISPMARIIVGDVGSGKTICAIASMFIAARSGYQSALMVPTEILARQHFADVSSLFSKLGISCELLLGSSGKKEKDRIYNAIESGSCDVIIGTHALISEKLQFSKLGLVITDEQHRFGVNQRSILKSKRKNIHMLVMSATPIPRTLALAMYGDLDVSRITDMPKGRMKVDTFVVDESYRKRLNDFISRQVAVGGQCYVVCPSIERNDDGETVMISDNISETLINETSLNLKNALEYSEELKSALPHLKIGILHGRMKAAEKDNVMAEFSSGNIDVLVSTTVIEVGVNVPNASLMIVENAERFGLSQLHQLRGRVGRGKRKSYCVLVSDLKTEKSQARLDVMRTTYDGYEIAEKDLLQRGPGDFFFKNQAGNFRQSGGFKFNFATKCDDEKIFDLAFTVAKSIVKNDPELAHAEHELLRLEIEKHITVNTLTLS